MSLRSRIRLGLVVGAALALVGVSLPPAAASFVDRDSGWIRYLEWTHDGIHHCAAQLSEIYGFTGLGFGGPAGASYVRFRSGSDCHADAVPAGWLAVRGYIVDDDGIGCAYLGGWIPNDTSTDTWSASTSGTTNQCSADHSYHMRAMGEVYRPNYGGFASSDWLDSPWFTP